MIQPTVEEKLTKRLFGVKQSTRSLFKFQAGYYITDENDNVMFFAKRDRFGFHRHIRIHDGDSDHGPIILIIKDNTISDSWGHFTVIDQRDGQVVGHLKRKFFKSMFRETWEYRDPNEQVIAYAQAKSVPKTIIRKFGLLRAIPIVGPILQLFMRLHFELVDPKGQKFGEFSRKATLRDRYVMSLGDYVPLDPRLVIASAILFDTGESR